MPLQPFSFPAGITLPAPVSLAPLLSWFFYLVIIYWLIYSLIAAHHWIAYSHNANIATPAIVLHAFVSLVLIGYAVSGVVFL